jgi:DMSO/TMAO reductase YedYZ molybdopterin-dependent catalytic subunit
LSVDGLVHQPGSFSLAALKARPRRSVEYTLECSGNNGGAPFFIGGIGNARWTGTPLQLLLRQARPADDATEVVFWGNDSGRVTIRDNSGIISNGVTGTTEPDTTGGLDLTITQQFARSMSLKEAMAPENLLCFRLARPAEERARPGHPPRQSAHDHRSRVGAPIARVEVQIDGGRWQAADLDRSRERAGFAWRFWQFDWGTPAAGEHTVRSRAFDTDGAMQPPPEDRYLNSRVTYWENNGQITRRIEIG